ncbi:MAG: response regulator transcription factor [Alphaproteobacteria bacterium]
MSTTYSRTESGRPAPQQCLAPTQSNSRATNSAAEAGCRTTIVIIEERELIRDCLARALRATGTHEAIALSSLVEWLNICNHTPASLVDLSYPGQADAEEVGHQLLRLAQTKRPLPEVVLSDSANVDQVLKALDKGAKGYIPTNLPLDAAIEAIRLVNAGGVFVPASYFANAQTPARSSGEPPVRRLFTARQAAVIEGIRRGKANKMIAYELNLQESTVKVHIRNIMKKLNAKNRTEVAYIANNLESTGSLQC